MTNVVTGVITRVATGVITRATTSTAVQHRPPDRRLRPDSRLKLVWILSQQDLSQVSWIVVLVQILQKTQSDQKLLS